MIYPQCSSIKPSAQARKLYGRMVAKANKIREDNNIEEFYLPLYGAISLSIELRNENKNPHAPKDTTELIQQGWISAHDNGGWKLSCFEK